MVESSIPTESAELSEDISWLLPKKKHAYYIVAPRYVRTSAGIKTLHLLCNALNQLGERAYMITRPYHPAASATNFDLNTPVLTKEILERDYQAGLTPIVVYSEIVSGNPLNAPFVVRYVMNFPGQLGGESQYDATEFCIAYSEILAKTVSICRMTIFFPASDPKIFTPYPEVARSGSCFYAGKYKYFHGGELFDITQNSIEITRDLPHSQTPEQIAELFRRSEVFYTYDNTALAIEATLCGCPVVFLPNQYLDKSIGLHEIGTDGMAWGSSVEELDRAKHTVHLARARYLHLFTELRQKLQSFIAQTQQAAEERVYNTPMHVPQCGDFNILIWVGIRWQELKLVIADIGYSQTTKIIINKIKQYVAGLTE